MTFLDLLALFCMALGAVILFVAACAALNLLWEILRDLWLMGWRGWWRGLTRAGRRA